MSPKDPKKGHVVQFAESPAKARQFSDDGTSSSAAIAEDRSVKSHYVLNSVIDIGGLKGREGEDEEAASAAKAEEPPADVKAVPKAASPASRMETYKAEWAANEGAAAERPLLPEDVERWREEKARRMVAWINNSQLTGYWGSETPWWKVMLREVEAAAERECGKGHTAVEEEVTRPQGQGQGQRHVAEEGEDADAATAAAMLSFFDSLNIVEGDGDEDGVADAKCHR